ncbi:hypothetical protein ABID20_000218 [Rhizobium alvei]|uniref:PilZ domain-containing protein n=2 Tax=Rhizobium alvei TaxID=1132659 RepID=A0ABT8YQP7_9HYPH|nr:PilZ domain-containing protein [Rhizobium alvei]MDO6965841.1 PilZ domain-containing protein [Rhizobium alvei]
MMYSAMPSDPRAAFQASDQGNGLVSVKLPGRLMRSDFSEHDCRAIEMSPNEVHFHCNAFPNVGERIVAYIEHLGRLEGTVTGHIEHGFVIRLIATDRKRDKLAAQLNWMANKTALGLPEDRRHERLMPRNTRSEIGLDDGRVFPCKIIDLSLSGAAVEIDFRPAIGTPVRLGHMRGRIVRHFQEGVAVEFSVMLSRESLEKYI